MESLYCTSPDLRNLVIKTADKTTQNFEHPIRLVEYIVLPDFGQRVILRFEFSDGRKVSFEEADPLESRLRSLVGTDHWANLIGGCFQHIPPDLAQRQITIGRTISSTVLRFLPTCHSDPLRKDAQIIRDELDLSDADLIWEIELPVLSPSDEPVIRIIEPARTDCENAITGRLQKICIGSEDFAVEYFEDDSSFIGLVKAYFLAEQKKMALASYVAQFDAH